MSKIETLKKCRNYNFPSSSKIYKKENLRPDLLYVICPYSAFTMVTFTVVLPPPPKYMNYVS